MSCLELIRIDIPEFPSCRKVMLEDKPVFDAIFTKHPPEVSAYTFTNIFSWSESYNTMVARIDDGLVIQNTIKGNKVYWEPLGCEDTALAIRNIVYKSEDSPVNFERISKSVALQFLDDDDETVVEEDRDNYDYLYLTKSLIELSGKHYDSKRNFIKRFKSHYDYQYEPITQATADECRDFAHRWCVDRSCESVEGMRKEQCAIYQMLYNYSALRLRGGAIRVDGEIVAFSLGEALNPETLVTHVEKADTSLEGAYPIINNEFCIHEGQDFKYVNREQDLGVPGLRKAKISYHPVKMVETYKLRFGF